MNLSTPDVSILIQAVTAISAFAPGFIIVFIRNQLLTGRTKRISELTAEYGLVSAVYYSSTLIVAERAFTSWTSLFLTLFVVPTLIGVILGIISQKGYSRTLLGKLHIKTVHPAPTAWDYIFGFSDSTHWVIVKLKDGSEVKGLFKRNRSFASSDLDSRDLFLSDVTNSDFGMPEKVEDTRGIWINESEIATIEFIGERA